MEPITDGVGQIWVGQTSGGIEIVAVIAVVACKPEDQMSFKFESSAWGKPVVHSRIDVGVTGVELFPVSSAAGVKERMP